MTGQSLHDLVEQMKAEHAAVVARGPICDFCSEPLAGTVWNYPTRSYTDAIAVVDAEVAESISEGDWTACAPCNALIQTGAWDELARRAIPAIRRDYPDTPGTPGTDADLLAGIKRVQMNFRAHWSGRSLAVAR